MATTTPILFVLFGWGTLRGIPGNEAVPSMEASFEPAPPPVPPPPVPPPPQPTPRRNVNSGFGGGGNGGGFGGGAPSSRQRSSGSIFDIPEPVSPLVVRDFVEGSLDEIGFDRAKNKAEAEALILYLAMQVRRDLKTGVLLVRPKRPGDPWVPLKDWMKDPTRWDVPVDLVMPATPITVTKFVSVWPAVAVGALILVIVAWWSRRKSRTARELAVIQQQPSPRKLVLESKLRELEAKARSRKRRAPVKRKKR